MEVVAIIAEIFNLFDDLTDNYGVYKVLRPLPETLIDSLL